MPKKKKPFIDKRNAQTFTLVQREIEPLDDAGSTEEDQYAKKIDEQHKYGIYYTDEYDYMQHLRDPRQKREVGIREEITRKKDEVHVHGTEPEVTEKTAEQKFAIGLDDGLFSMANSEAVDEIDTELTEALESGVGDELEDDFVQMALGTDDVDGPSDGACGSFSDDGDDELDDDEMLDLRNIPKAAMMNWLRGVQADDDEDNCVAPKLVPTKQTDLSAADQRFEELLKEYDCDEDCSCDDDCNCDEGCGVTAEAVQAYIKQNKQDLQSTNFHELLGPAREHVRPSDIRDSDEEEFEYVIPETKLKPRYDAASIISTYSNTQNIPTTIDVPRDISKVKLSKKSGIPLDMLRESAPTRRHVEQVEHEMAQVRLTPASGSRPANETPQERRARKAAVKEDRRFRRMEKKQNKIAFKAEKIRVERCQAGQQVQASVKI